MLERFPPQEIAIKLLISTGIGLLVGFEREWARKDLGVRTFATICLLGMLSGLLPPGFSYASMAGVIVLIGLMNVGNIVRSREFEATTSAALLVTFALGVLVGQGHVFTPSATAIVMTLLLAMKPQFSRFAGGLTAEELRGAVLLGLIGFVIYPILPNRFVDPWRLLNPREAWLIIILIASLGFVNYVLLKIYGARGLYYSAIFGGLVNSTAAIAELAPLAAQAPSDPVRLELVVTLLTIMPMFLRNAALLAVFSPTAGLLAAPAMAVMLVCAGACVWWFRTASVDLPPLKLTSPISIKKLASFGILFLFIQMAGALGQRLLGSFGAIAVSVVGGLASSASATAAAGALTTHGDVQPNTAALCAVTASIASVTINLPLVYRAMRQRDLLRKLIFITAAISAAGIAAFEISRLSFLARFL